MITFRLFQCRCLGLMLALAASTPIFGVELRIERKIQTPHAIQGYLLVDGAPVCYTLELPYNDNIEFISAIPPGHYKGIIRRDGAKGWRIELKGVPGRERIEIHVGNYTRDTTGCTLVGMDVDIDHSTVGHSAEALTKLKMAVEKSADTEIGVTYSSPP